MKEKNLIRSTIYTRYPVSIKYINENIIDTKIYHCQIKGGKQSASCAFFQ